MHVQKHCGPSKKRISLVLPKKFVKWRKDSNSYKYAFLGSSRWTCRLESVQLVIYSFRVMSKRLMHKIILDQLTKT